MRKIIPLLIIALFQLSLLSSCQRKTGDETGGSAGNATSVNDGLFRKSFEGILHMRMSAPEGFQKAKLYLSKKGTRFEMDLADPKSGQTVMSIVTFTPSEEPNLVYTLNEKDRTYAVLDMDELPQDLAGTAEEKLDDFKVEKLGTETLHGYKCTHVLVTDANSETEMWLTKDLLSAADFARLQRQGGKDRASSASFDKRLKKAGLEGFPLKIVDRNTGMTTEFTEIEKKTLDDSLFRVPQGYEKKESALQMMAPQISNEDMKQLENLQEMMKDKDMQKDMQEMMKQFEGMRTPGK
ncbi:hypothetical protein CHL67_10105 [Prosthecochloris sp. GSB1]|uniref:DUF4412 domain-containing protein n=1 Tax=Prosthecochloris sp. GSB1 TaxID=281093 RepID=UPI000B8CFA9D|nr:DUF4412 domain-containing protein [Prosthecochloris sp. GSB1]ASQ91216.1 hypothetical protein CHL67_10105 [Prosthecochloris sp. GSB1]